jgi:hypothetical protein
LGQCAAHPQDTHYLKKVKVAVENCTSILQLLDQEITRSFKHVIQPYCKETISVIDHKMLRNATFMMVEVVDAPPIIVELWHCVTLTSVAVCSEKCGFN